VARVWSFWCEIWTLFKLLIIWCAFRESALFSQSPLFAPLLCFCRSNICYVRFWTSDLHFAKYHPCWWFGTFCASDWMIAILFFVRYNHPYGSAGCVPSTTKLKLSSASLNLSEYRYQTRLHSVPAVLDRMCKFCGMKRMMNFYFKTRKFVSIKSPLSRLRGRRRLPNT